MRIFWDFLSGFGFRASFESRISGFGFLAALLAGCAVAPPRAPVAWIANPAPEHPRQFDFQKDTFAYANELSWEYGYDARGKWKVLNKRKPKPDYRLHCLVVARSARQFFQFAHFDPKEPVADEATYRELIGQVVASNPRRVPARPGQEDGPPEADDASRITIPGYPDLRTFSQAHGKLLKAECGGAWQSYFARGNWRMIFPFTHHEQEQTAARLVEDLRRGLPLVVHLVSFPRLLINHSVLVFDAKKTDTGTEFTIYDPNEPATPRKLAFDKAARSFQMESNNYFPGGALKAYELFWKWDY